MNEKAHITPEEHQKQIQAYRAEFPRYEQYANVLRRIFQNAFPMTVVQAREKSISSFAEKCVRKFDKYPDPVNMLTDLCGARIIVQTLDLVSGVRKFIEENFTVLEMDNKSESHSEEEFGYNDLHYIVQLRVDREIGVTRDEFDAIQERRAEIQVRTVLQHAWADILHDRIYKTVVSVPPEWRREANRLAALLEKADQSFGQLADALDSQTSAYEVYLTREKLGEEINTLRTILEAEQTPERKPELALKLGRVLMAANEWGKAADILTKYSSDAPAFAIEKGYALCLAAKDKQESKPFRKGVALLAGIAAPDQSLEFPDAYAPSSAGTNVRPSQRAKALYRLGRIYWLYQNDCKQAAKCFFKAHTLRLDNPYYHVAYVQAELCKLKNPALLQLTAAGLRADIERCRQHVTLGIELPNALLTIARCHLLLGDTAGCLSAYAKAIEICVPKNSCMPNELFDTEIKAVEHLSVLNSSLSEQVLTLLHLARWRSRCMCQKDEVSQASHSFLARQRLRRSHFKTPVLIIIGGAKGMVATKVPHYYGYLLEALDGFQGTVIAGGTKSGIPKVVGDFTSSLADARGNTKAGFYDLLAYLPSKPYPEYVPDHESYRIAGRTKGHDFSEREVIAYWVDLLLDGVDPAKVLILGINGGRIASFEYRLALALGATVGVLRDSGRAAAALLADPDWKKHPRLNVLPEDNLVIWAFANRYNSPTLSPDEIDRLAPEAHEFYRQNRFRKGETSDESLKPWDQLSQATGFADSNKEQMSFVDNVLRKTGFQIRKVGPGTPVPIIFSAKEIEEMARREHARWMCERTCKGWVYGKNKNSEKKISPYLVDWKELPDSVKTYDREAVKLFPFLLAKLGYEIYRNQ